MRSGIFDNIVRKSQLFGNGKCITLSRNTDQQTVSWPERCNVELAARIFYARCLERKNLQFTVVSGCHGADALSMQMTQNRDGKSSAFGRIGSGTKFVEEYQRIVFNLL